MLRRIEAQADWDGTPILDPHVVVGSRPETFFYELRDHGLCRMSLNLVTALAEYRDAPSGTACRDLHDVVSWLRECTYTSDLDQFGTADIWMHPADFELTRRGDCDDHALWAYSRLAQLGHEVRYVVGTSPSGGGHAWVTVRAPDRRWLLMETTAKAVSRVSWSPDVDAGPYQPAWSVDQHHVFHGYADQMRWTSPAR